jgi:hypothetical protein
MRRRSWLRHCATSRKIAGSVTFFIDITFWFTVVLGSTHPLNRNEYLGYCLGYRWPVRRADNLATFMCRFSRNPGNLNLLEP